jgi:hypothetical protein
MRICIVVVFLFFGCSDYRAQDFITFKADGISTFGQLSLTQTIHSNSFKEKDSLVTSNTGFALSVGRLVCWNELPQRLGDIWSSANANIGVKHTRTLAQKLLSSSAWNSTIPSPLAETEEIFSHYQIGDYLLMNNTGLTISGEFALFGVYLGLEVGGGVSMMKSGFVNNDSQRLRDAGFYYEGSASFGYTFRYFKIFFIGGTSSFAFNSVNWTGKDKKEKDFSSLQGANLTTGGGLSIVIPIKY